MQTISELIDLLRQGTLNLNRMAEKLEFPWSPDMDDPRKLHNMYVRNLFTCYVSKFAQLSGAVIDSIDDKRYLVYALAGRSLIESTATLRYYVLHRYKPLLDKGTLSSDDLMQLIEIDDCHLRGGRFDWESFLSKRYSLLKEDAVKQLASKKAKPKHISQGIVAEQVNVLTCIEKWAEVTPEVLIAYNLFCDLVHPNVGSSFLVASTTGREFFFTPAKGHCIGEDIFTQSFPILLSVTQKPFGEYLMMLLATIWQDVEM
jgi:hypothetical protein